VWLLWALFPFRVLSAASWLHVHHQHYQPLVTGLMFFKLPYLSTVLYNIIWRLHLPGKLTDPTLTSSLLVFMCYRAGTRCEFYTTWNSLYTNYTISSYKCQVTSLHMKCRPTNVIMAAFHCTITQLMLVIRPELQLNFCWHFHGNNNLHLTCVNTGCTCLLYQCAT